MSSSVGRLVGVFSAGFEILILWLLLMFHFGNNSGLRFMLRRV